MHEPFGQGYGSRHEHFTKSWPEIQYCGPKTRRAAVRAVERRVVFVTFSSTSVPSVRRGTTSYVSSPGTLVTEVRRLTLVYRSSDIAVQLCHVDIRVRGSTGFILALRSFGEISRPSVSIRRSHLSAVESRQFTNSYIAPAPPLRW